MDTFTTAAAHGFSLLAQQYKMPGIFAGNFWFGGNSLHTCLEYLLVAKANDTEKPYQILTTAYQIYQDAQSNPNWWHDDYGWWGNAFLVALNNRAALGYGAPTYDSLFKAIESATEFCWTKLTDSWSNTPYGSTPKDNAAGKADITGGSFNVPVTQNQPPMQGRNSVTNEGFWLLSLGLATRNPTVPRYAAMATALQNWYQQWLQLPSKVKGAIGILNPNGLVLERPTGNRTAPTWFWSGDQGLFCEALFVSGLDRSLAVMIADATKGHMTDGVGILHENLGFVDAGLGQFLADYATGKGIFMRGLAVVNAGTGNRYEGFIKLNAAKIWCNQDKDDNGKNTYQFTFNWNRAPGYEPIHLTGKGQALCNLIMQAAAQDALTAAMRLAPIEPITCA